MKTLLAAAVVAILCGTPGMARAETHGEPGKVAAPARTEGQPPGPDGDAQNPEGDANEYAEREAAAPQLAEFAGGADGVYVSAGAIAVALLVVLLIVAL